LKVTQQTTTSGRQNSGLKGKIDIQEKTEEFLFKRLKNCERNMQKLSKSMKRQNLQITGIEEGKKSKSKVYAIYSAI
jgi:flagella basal body P-ring formation protein FlgA